MCKVSIGQVFQEEQKKSHYTGWSYGLSTQRVLKSLSSLHVSVMTIFPWSIWYKICSTKINALLAWIPIPWWFSRAPQIFYNLLLSQGKYVRIMLAYKDATLSPHASLMLDLKPGIAKRFQLVSNILEDPQHAYITH